MPQTEQSNGIILIAGTLITLPSIYRTDYFPWKNWSGMHLLRMLGIKLWFGCRERPKIVSSPAPFQAHGAGDEHWFNDHV